MKTYNFDAFGNPVQTTATNNLPIMLLSSDGVYDPALAACYAPIRRNPTSALLFTSPDICAGEASPPASLRRFGYANETAIDAADPV